MKPEECKTAKKLRYAQMFFFVLIIIFLIFPYVGGVITTDEGSEYRYYTAIDLMFNLSAQNVTFIKLGVVSLVFAVLPAAGFFTAAFDRHRIIKGIVGIVTSFLGIFCITFMLKNTISLGAVVSIILYLITFIISVMLTLVKFSENRELKENGTEYVEEPSKPNRLPRR